MATTIVVSIFFGLLIIGAPVAVALGGAVAVAATFFSTLPLPVLGQKIYGNLDTFTLMAVPFFFLAASLMEVGGIVNHLVQFANIFVGRLRGGLGITAVLTSMFFAAICGSSSATCAAVGGIMIPTLMKNGYSRKYAVGLIATAGCLGILVPPSIPLIIYGFITETSIPKLFVAGLLPALVFAFLVMLMARFMAIREGVPIAHISMSTLEKLRAFRLSAPALFLPVFLVIGIYGFPPFQLGSIKFGGGAMFTPTEGAVMCAFGALLIGALIYRQTTMKSFFATVVSVAPRIGMLYWIITNAILFGFFLGDQGVPQALAQWLVSQETPQWLFLLGVNVILIVAGLFLDGVPMVLMFVPVLYPAARAMGVDPYHFAIIVVVNIELGLQHPPVGMNLFVVSSISGTPLPQVIMATLPWMAVTLVMLLVVTYVPWLSTVLLAMMAN